MLTDENPELRTEAAGGRDHHPEEQGGEQELDLQCHAPPAPEVPDEIAGAGNGDQEDA